MVKKRLNPALILLLLFAAAFFAKTGTAAAPGNVQELAPGLSARLPQGWLNIQRAFSPEVRILSVFTSEDRTSSLNVARLPDEPVREILMTDSPALRENMIRKLNADTQKILREHFRTATLVEARVTNLDGCGVLRLRYKVSLGDGTPLYTRQYLIPAGSEGLSITLGGLSEDAMTIALLEYSLRIGPELLDACVPAQDVGKDFSESQESANGPANAPYPVQKLLIGIVAGLALIALALLIVLKRKS